MAHQLKYQGLKDALDEGVKSLHKWYGRVDSTSLAISNVLVGFATCRFWYQANDPC